MENYKSKYLMDYIFIPDSIVGSFNLSMGAKLCYGLLHQKQPVIDSMKCELMAQEIGVTEKEFNRFFNELKKKGYVEINESGKINLCLFE